MDPAVAKEMSGAADIDWSEQCGANNACSRPRLSVLENGGVFAFVEGLVVG